MKPILLLLSFLAGLPALGSLTLPAIFSDGMVLQCETLKQGGYRTIHVGKAHFGSNATGQNPLNLGFDVNIGAMRGAILTAATWGQRPTAASLGFPPMMDRSENGACESS